MTRKNIKILALLEKIDKLLVKDLKFIQDKKEKSKEAMENLDELEVLVDEYSSLCNV